MNDLKSNPKVFSFIADHVIYDDAMIYLGEGLKELNVEFYSNRNYWKESPHAVDFLFNYDPQVDWRQCDIVVLSSPWYHYIDPISYQIYSQEPPKDLFASSRKYLTIYLDVQDGYRTNSWDNAFRNFDLILRGKYNKNTYNPSNLRPWLHGFTNRTIFSTQEQLEPKDRKRVILQNFNYSHSYVHGVRALAIDEILPEFKKCIPVDNTITSKSSVELTPYHKLMWDQTEERHHPEYYKMLCTSFANACFCGDLIPALPFNPGIYLKGGNKAKLVKKMYSALSSALGKKQRIIQWDSWRFWETLSAGCLAIHIDIEKHGVALPVMPINWKHYVGIDLHNLKRDVERFCDDDAALFDIAKQGKAWVFENYSPKASAKRFLNMVSEHGN